MTTEVVCERVGQLEGMDQSMMGQYSATIRKVGHMMITSSPQHCSLYILIGFNLFFRLMLTEEFCLSVTWKN